MNSENDIRLHGDATPQYILCAIVNLLAFNYGAFIFEGPEYLSLKYIRSLLYIEGDEKFIQDVKDKMEEVFFIGCILGIPFFAYLAHKIGRKTVLILIAVSFLFDDMFFLLPQHSYCLYVGSLLTGLGSAGLAIILPIYLAETTEDYLRGVLGAYFCLSLSLGELFSKKADTFIPDIAISSMKILITVSFLVGSFWLPETPIYSLLKKKTKEAQNALTKLRGNYPEVVEDELESGMVEDESSIEQPNFNLGNIRNCIPDFITRKALIIGCVFFTLIQLSRKSVLISIGDSVPNILEYGDYLHYALTLILEILFKTSGIIITILLIERGGRKFLILISTSGVATIYTFYFSLELLKQHINVEHFGVGLREGILQLPLIAGIFFIIIYNLGVKTVPWILLSELFKTKAKISAISFCMMVFWTASFLISKYYSLSSEKSPYNVAAGHSIICTICWVFTYFYVIETKGKSIETILEDLSYSVIPG